VSIVGKEETCSAKKLQEKRNSKPQKPKLNLTLKKRYMFKVFKSGSKGALFV